MNLDQIICALRERCPTFQQRIAGAAQWAGLTEDENPPLPAAYVIPLREDAGQNESEVSYYQTVTNIFGVVLLVPNFADERGQDASRWIELLKREVFKAILSWRMEPSDEYSEIVFDGGSLIYMDDARAAYQLDFAFETYLDISDSWQEGDLDALPPFEGLDVDVDCIDPSSRKDEPDGQLEGHFKVDL